MPKVNKDYVNANPRTHVTRSILKLSNTPTYITYKRNRLPKYAGYTHRGCMPRALEACTGYVIDRKKHNTPLTVATNNHRSSSGYNSD